MKTFAQFVAEATDTPAFLAGFTSIGSDKFGRPIWGDPSKMLVYVLNKDGASIYARWPNYLVHQPQKQDYLAAIDRAKKVGLYWNEPALGVGAMWHKVT